MGNMNTVELQNPHTKNALASIENGARGLAFSSSGNRLFDAGLKPGDEVIAMDDLYGELTDCLRKFIKIQVYYSIL
jgi:O-acetylhomoserine/O-acetylserine sulfhydrylase-like pyridoxal-dependent enzyme